MSRKMSPPLSNPQFPSEEVVRVSGLTSSERYLKKLCDRTFLSLWGYANLYRKQGKELCDLLIVFGDHVIIFSDKNCKFTNTAGIPQGWERWFRKAVKESAQQAWGTEKWIKQFPEAIFLDSKCTKKFPYCLPSPNKAKFHLVLVAHGAANQCRVVLGGSGSLMLRNDIQSLSNHTEPFTIGDLDPLRTFIHVFDDTTLAILMRTLDTVDDFTTYLQKKESLFRSEKTVFAAGEEELLAIYLKNLNSNGEHDFIFPTDNQNIAIMEGLWEHFQKHPQRLAQIEANKVSYTWDRLIEDFNKYILAGKQEYVTHPPFESSEKIIRFLASQPRFMRRALAESLLEIMKETPVNKRMLRVMPPFRSKDPYFVFLVFPYRDNRPVDENRLVRRKYLEACCKVVKLTYPDALDIVGLATESGRLDRNEGSEDACYLDARVWSAESEIEAKELQSELGILVNMAQKPFNIKEYPKTSTASKVQAYKAGRNDKCPCGSRKKFKKCHGK